jgi:hypothetical protein
MKLHGCVYVIVWTRVPSETEVSETVLVPLELEMPDSFLLVHKCRGHGFVVARCLGSFPRGEWYDSGLSISTVGQDRECTTVLVSDTDQQ